MFAHPDETFKPKPVATKKFDVNQYMQNRYNADDEPLLLEATQKSSQSQMDFYQDQMIDLQMSCSHTGARARTWL